MNYADAGYVYAITNTVNGKQYIGSTICRPILRWNTHKSRLRRGIHHSYKLQSGWDSYGECAFDFRVILVCQKEQVLEYEGRLLPSSSYNIIKDTKSGLAARRWLGHVKKEKPKSLPMSVLTASGWRDPVIRAKRIAGLKVALAQPEVQAKKRIASTGRVMSVESVSKTAKAKWNSVNCVELGKVFSSQKECAEFFNVVTSTVSNALKLHTKIGGKYTLVRV